MPILNSEVEKIARLAKLRFSGAQLETLSSQLGKIVAFVDQLGEVDTTDVQPMAHPLDVNTVVRADAVTPSLTRDAALSNAPARDDECFRVPPVMSKQ